MMYTPDPLIYAGGDLSTDELARYIKKELDAISGISRSISDGLWDVVSVQPARSRQGQVLFTDGTWSPVGTGSGLVFYDGSAWRRIWDTGLGGPVLSFNTRSGNVTLTSGDVTGALGFTPYNATNPAGYISGITSGMVTAALGFTPESNTASFNLGTTSIALNRASAAQSLTGINIDGSAGSVPWTGVSGRPTAVSAFTNDAGYAVGTPDTAATVNTLAKRTVNGYLFATYFNQNSGSAENPVIGAFFVENSGADGYLRKSSVAAVRSALGGAGSGLNADLHDGYDTATANTASTVVVRDASSVIAASQISLSGTINVSSAGGQLCLVPGTGSVTFAGWAFPTADNTDQLGLSSNRWSIVYSAGGVLTTSDQRQKTAIKDSDLGLNFVLALRPVRHRWIDGGGTVVGMKKVGERIVDYRMEGDRKVPITEDVMERIIVRHPGVRIHYSFLAQQVKQVLDDQKVEDFGGWTLADKNDPDSAQALNYAEFIPPMVKAIQELATQVAALQAGAKK